MTKKHSTLLVLFCVISMTLFAQNKDITLKSVQSSDYTNQYTFFNINAQIQNADQNFAELSDAVSIDNMQLTANGNQTMIPINVTINAGRSDLRLVGVIQFVKCGEGNEIITGSFTTNLTSIIEIPEGAYYVCAWIAGNSTYSKTWLGNSTLCDSTKNTCNTQIIPAASQFNTSSPNLTFNLLEYDRCGIFARSNIIVNILDQRASATATGHPIRDVDVTLMKIPPAKAFCQTLVPNGTVVSQNITYSKLNSSTYYLLLDIPDLPVRYEPCIDLKSGENYQITLIVRDDGIYRQE